MTNILGPHGPGIREVMARPLKAASGYTGDSWFGPCVAGDPSTGTLMPADWANDIAAQLRHAIRGMSITEDEADDDMLLKAVQKAQANAQAAAATDATTKANAARAQVIPAGTRTTFWQAAAPLGWTKVTDVLDHALRVTSGTGGGAGGSSPFSSVFGARSISRANLPNVVLATDSQGTHTHTAHSNLQALVAGTLFQSGSGTSVAAGAQTITVDAAGAHTHTTESINGGITQLPLDFAVDYLNVIMCSKDAYA